MATEDSSGGGTGGPPSRGLDALARASTLRLTTTGRRMGLPRTVELSFALEGDHLLLLAHGRQGTRWAMNLRVHPQAKVQVGRRTWEVEATVPQHQGTTRARALELLQEKYGKAYVDRWYRGTERLVVWLEVFPDEPLGSGGHLAP